MRKKRGSVAIHAFCFLYGMKRRFRTHTDLGLKLQKSFRGRDVVLIFILVKIDWVGVKPGIKRAGWAGWGAWSRS